MKKYVATSARYGLLFFMWMISFQSDAISTINKIPAAPSVQGSLYNQQATVSPQPASLSTQLTLDQIYELSKNQTVQPVTRSQQIISGEKSDDTYAQSQAHMSVPEVKKLIAAQYDTKPYQKLIEQILEKEKKYADDFVFYHGLDNPWRTPQDVYTRLYAHFNAVPLQSSKDFIFLRFNGMSSVAVNNFLMDHITQSGLINDHRMGNDIIATNLALFGNVGTPSECTWEYFIKSRGHANPSREIYEKIMDKFGLTHHYIDELMSLTSSYQTKEQTILQIFVPKDKVDSIGYLSWVRGIPADQDIMRTVTRGVEDKTFTKNTPALDHYTKIFRQAKEADPLFKNLVDRIKKGEFSLSYFLNFYRTKPQQIEDINSFQARLFATHEVLLNPYSGVKIFRYSTATPAQLKKYEEKLAAIIKKIIAQKK